MRHDDELLPPEKSPLESLQGKLYGTEGFTRDKRKGELNSNAEELARAWRPAPPADPRLKESFTSAFFTKFLWASFAFFLVAVAVSAFILLRGSNLISSQNVDMYISGPVAVEAGQPLSLQVAIENKNSVSLESVNLVAEYPQGAYSKDDPTTPLVRNQKPLDTIAPGQTVNEVAESILFGEKGTEKDIKLSIEYRVKGSSAVFTKEKVFKVAISSSPLSLDINTLSEVNAGTQFEVQATVTSNANVPIKNVLFKAEYPFGFSFVDSTPVPIKGNNIWTVGDLAPGEKKVIILHGVIDGQDTEEKVFRLFAGTQKDTDPQEIGALYSTQLKSIAIARPFLAVTLKFNHGSPSDNFVSNSQTDITGHITWQNNLSTKLLDTRIDATILGNVHEKSSVNVEQAFYRSDVNIIHWDKTTDPDLATLEPGKSGNVSFSFKSKALASQGQIIRNPTMGVDLDVTGRRISESGVPEEIKNTIHGKIKLNSHVELGQRLVYSVGPFKNTGPVPPRAEKETTYTVIWDLTNTSNDLRNAVVRATLPPYVKWKGVFSPSTESITYNDLAGQVIWRPGQIQAGVGILNAPREVAFQVTILPSISQVGTSPSIYPNANFTAIDTFTESTLEFDARELNTRISTDPIFHSGSDQVVP